MSESVRGVLAAVGAYLCWGVLPLFWAIFDPVGNGWEVIGHRIIWTGVILLLWQMVAGGLGRFAYFIAKLKAEPRKFMILVAAAAASAFNFWVNVAGVITGHVVELGIGTFLTPLMTVAIGMIVFREKTTKTSAVATLLAAAGVAVMIVRFGSFPFYALAVSLSWAVYGALKKVVMLEPVGALTVETVLMMPVAAGYLVLLAVQGTSHFSFATDFRLAAAFIATGLVATVPLLAFAYGAMRLRLTVLGFIQYLAPLIILAFGVFVFNEPFGKRELCPLLFVWSGIAVFLFGQLSAAAH